MKKRNLLRVVLCVLLVSSMLINVLATGAEPVVTGSGTAEDPTHTSVTETVPAGTGAFGGETTVETTNTTISGETENADGSTTTVTGSEIKTVTTEHYSDGSTATVTGTLSGSQDTTTKKVDTEDNVLVYDNTGAPEDVSPENKERTLHDDAEYVQNGSESDTDWSDPNKVETEWSDWSKGETVEGTEKVVGTTDAAVPDPLENQNVTINLTPDNQENTSYLEVPIADVVAANKGALNPYDLSAATPTKTVTLDGGKEATVRAEFKDGELIGYTITTLTGDTGTVIRGKLEDYTFGADKAVDPVLPEEYTGDDFKVQDDGSTKKTEGPEDNQTVTHVVKGTDDAGDPVYTVTKTTTTITRTPETIEETETDALEVPQDVLEKICADLGLTLPETNEGDLVKTKITPPVRPADVADQTDEAGNTIKTTIEEGEIDGVPVFITKVVKTDKDGNELESRSTTIYGTIEVSVYDPVKMERLTTTTITDVETTNFKTTQKKRVVEVDQTQTFNEDTYILVPTEDGVKIAYTGTMDVSDASVSSIEKSSITPDEKFFEHLAAENPNEDEPWKWDLQGHAWKNDKYTGFMASQDTRNALMSQLDDGEYTLVGYGLLSSYNVYDDPGGANGVEYPHLPTQYVVMDNTGALYYGYCVELGKDLKWMSAADDAVYKEKDLASYDENNDVYFARDEQAITLLSSIANNGYWGTESGIGSLDAVKTFMESNKQTLKSLGYSDAEITAIKDSITEGQAVTATQSAIWSYGTNGKETLSDVDRVIKYYKNNDWQVFKDKQDANGEYRNINAYYQLLTAVAEAEKQAGTTEMKNAIGKDDVTGGSIKLYDTVKDSNGKVVTAANGEKKYNADVAFTLAMGRSSINGDLVLHVFANGDTTTPIATKRLASNADNVSAFSGASKDGITIEEVNGQTVITVSGLQLAENTNITLKLEGVQHLENGVYIYEAPDSQNFLGLASAKRAMDMTITMNFNVTDPESVEHRNRTVQKTREGKVTETETDQWQKSNRTITTEAERVTQVYADLTVTTTTDMEETWRKNWEESYPQPFEKENDPEEKKKEEEIKDEDVPLEDIFEEEIPLADVPKTGDGSAIWMVLSVLSALGLAVMFLFDRKRKEV